MLTTTNTIDLLRFSHCQCIV